MSSQLDSFVGSLYVLYYIPLAFAAHFYHVDDPELSTILILIVVAMHFLVGGIVTAVEGPSQALKRFTAPSTGIVLICANIILAVALAFSIFGIVVDSAESVLTAADEKFSALLSSCLRISNS